MKNLNKLKEQIEKFRERVGGSIYIFLVSFIFFLEAVVLFAVGIEFLLIGHIVDGLKAILVSVVEAIFARLLFLFMHWFFKFTDRVFDKLKEKVLGP